MSTKVTKTSEEIEEMKRTIAEAEAMPTHTPEAAELTDDALDAELAKLQATKHKKAVAASAGLLKDYLPRLVALVKDGGKIKAAHPKWCLPFTMRSDNLLANAVLARGKASPQDVMDDIGQYLPSLLAKDMNTGLVPEPHEWVVATLAEKSRDKDSNGRKLRPILKDNEDGTYSLAD
jgi:hypothetical protein